MTRPVNQRTINRRTVLRGAGVAVCLPWLEAMMPSVAFGAAPAKAPLRLAFLYVPNGMHMPDWTPEKEGAGFDIKPTLQPVAHLKDHINLLSGLTLDGARAHKDGGGDHARSAAAFLTGAHPKKTDGADIHNGVSIDQAIAQAVGDKTRFASLELGLEGSSQAGSCDSGYSCAYSSNLAWRNPTQSTTPEYQNPTVKRGSEASYWAMAKVIDLRDLGDIERRTIRVLPTKARLRHEQAVGARQALNRNRQLRFHPTSFIHQLHFSIVPALG